MFFLGLVIPVLTIVQVYSQGTSVVSDPLEEILGWPIPIVSAKERS